MYYTDGAIVEEFTLSFTITADDAAIVDILSMEGMN